MSSRPQLVLDLGGVLVTNLSPLFWQQLANHSNVPYDDLVNRYKQDVRETLWSGAITEDDFWNWLSGSFSTVDGKTARELLHAIFLHCLPCVNLLSGVRPLTFIF